jgi:hypothetical protein
VDLVRWPASAINSVITLSNEGTVAWAAIIAVNNAGMPADLLVVEGCS